jgi:pyruvate dehydrogenase E2 component (dihydrolipoamide acetyltransferase)
METVKVLRWLKRVGDKVAMGQPLVELETDKATMEVESPAEGTLEEILGAEGEELSVGAILARLRTVGDSALPSKAEPAAAPPSRKVDLVAAASRSSPESPGSRILASPFAKRLAKLNETDLAALAARNPLRRIRGRDVIAAIETPDAKPKSTMAASAGFEPFSSARRQIAESVSLSRRIIPFFTIDRWVETTAIDRARATLDREIETAVGIKPTLTDFLLQALAQSFVVHLPMLDRWHEVNGEPGRMRASSVDIGLVVDLADSLMIPVLRDLAGKSLGEIAQARRQAVQRARSGRLQQADFAPVAFSVSNLGRSGADRFEAIIYPGQSGILAVGRQHERVIARAGGIAVANGVNLTLSFDHRLIDGLLGAQFIDTLAERMERWPGSGS